MTRLFFGIEIPSPLKQEIGELQQSLKNAGIQSGNWSPPELFHLTVLFLGDLDEKHLPVLNDIGESAATQVQPFELSLSNVGTFPKNRVLWVGLENNNGVGELTRLHLEVRRRVAQLNLVAVENRPYRPHMTLARKLNGDAQNMLGGADSAVKVGAAARPFTVEHLCLFASKRIEGRLAYPVLSRFPLGSGVAST